MKVIKFFGDHPPVLTQMLYSIQQDQLLFFRKRCVPIIIAAKKVLKHENIVNFLQYLFKIYSLAGGRLLLLGGHSAAWATTGLRLLSCMLLLQACGDWLLNWRTYAITAGAYNWDALSWIISRITQNPSQRWLINSNCNHVINLLVSFLCYNSTCGNNLLRWRLRIASLFQFKAWNFLLLIDRFHSSFSRVVIYFNSVSEHSGSGSPAAVECHQAI